MAKLVYQDPESGQDVTVELSDAMPVVTIGRNPGNIVRVNNPSISRQHAKVVWEGGVCTLFDLDSSNGSYVNGSRIRSQILNDSDRLRVGEFPIQFFGVNPALEADTAKDHDSSIPTAAGVPVWADGTPKAKTDLGGFEADGSIRLASERTVDEASPSAPPPPPNHWSELEPASAAVDLAEPSNVADSFFPRTEVSDEEDLHDVDALISNDDIVSVESSEAYADDAGPASLEDPDSEPLSVSAPPFPAPNDRPPIFDDAPKDPNDYDTFEASIELINQHREQSSDASDGGAEELPVATYAEPAPEQPAHAPQLNAELVEQANAAYEQRIEELTAERDDLLDLLQTRAGDVSGASKVQIERLRSERDRLIDERRKLQRQLDALGTQLADLPSPDAVAQMRFEYEQAQQMVREFEQNVSDLKDVVHERDETLRATQEELDGIRVELDAVKASAMAGESAAAQVLEMNSELDAARSVVEELEAELEAAGAQYSEVHQAYEEGTSRQEALEARVDDLTAELGGARAQVQESERDIAELQSQLAGANQKLDELVLERDELVAELERRPVAEEVQGMLDEMEVLTTDLEQTRGKVVELESAKTDLERALSDHEQLYDALEERFEKQGVEFEALRRDRDGLKTEKGAFARETDYLQVEKRQLDAEVRSLKKSIKELTSNDKRKKVIFDELRGDLEKLVKENNGLQEQIEKLKTTVDNSPTHDELSSARREREEAEAKRSQAEASFTSAQKEIDAMGVELGTEKQRAEELEKQLEQANIELSALRDMVADGSAALEDVDEVKRHAQDLTSELALTQKKLTSKEKEADALLEKVSDLEVQVAELQRDAASGESAIAAKVGKLESQLLDAETALAEVILERDKLEDQLKQASS